MYIYYAFIQSINRLILEKDLGSLSTVNNGIPIILNEFEERVSTSKLNIRYIL